MEFHDPATFSRLSEMRHRRTGQRRIENRSGQITGEQSRGESRRKQLS
jgi:hypothetical protein